MVKSISVLGRKYRVKYTCPEKMKKDIGFNVFGFCNLENDTIYIDKNLKENKLTTTLYHEIVHCIFHRIGADQVLSHELQEMLCESIGSSFFEMHDKTLRKITRLEKEIKRQKEIIDLLKGSPQTHVEGSQLS